MRAIGNPVAALVMKPAAKYTGPSTPAEKHVCETIDCVSCEALVLQMCDACPHLWHTEAGREWFLCRADHLEVVWAWLTATLDMCCTCPIVDVTVLPRASTWSAEPSSPIAQWLKTIAERWNDIGKIVDYRGEHSIGNRTPVFSVRWMYKDFIYYHGAKEYSYMTFVTMIYRDVHPDAITKVKHVIRGVQTQCRMLHIDHEFFFNYNLVG